MAPVLSFTAEEAWQVFKGGTDGSLFEEQWHEIPKQDFDAALLDAWKDVRDVRDVANKRIEEQRAQGVVGSPLQAELEIKVADQKSFESLQRLGDDLRFVLITSSAKVVQQAGAGLTIDVKASAHTKCERCWHYRADVGHDANHPDLCGRCTSNLGGAGEPRRYA